jgi:hypothetical protein
MYLDVLPTPHLALGDKRLWTCFKIFVELRDDTTLRIPFREASKVHIFPSPTPRLNKVVELAMGW